jgi:hypothetical protein
MRMRRPYCRWSAADQEHVSGGAHRGDMSAISHALLAVQALERGDDVAAAAHLATAQQQSRTMARRQRQVVEMAALVVAGNRERAAGLALVHTAEFGDDRALLAGLTGGPEDHVIR